MAPQVAMGPGLQRRLMLLLLLPLLLVSLINIGYDVRLADIATNQQDKQLAALAPSLADSVVAKGNSERDGVGLLMSPAVGEFLREKHDLAAFALLNSEGRVMLGEEWLGAYPPSSHVAEFSSEERDGVTYRIVSQRFDTAAGDLTVRIADGSDPRQQWMHGLWYKVFWPNLLLAIVVAFAVNWAVRRALRPLLELKVAVEGRSLRDLSHLNPLGSPDEVRPLVESINRLFDLVNAQAESQRRFVADAAHQLRTPLAGLQSQVEAWAQALEGQSEITLTTDQVLKLRQATRRTSQLANQLLALSRADVGTTGAQPSQKVDLKATCETILEEQLAHAASKGIDLGLEAQPVRADGYEWLLRELLANLVDNAIRYTPAGGRVTVRCGRRGAYPLGPLQPFVEVEDDGPGIPPQDHDKVLQRFYRLPGSVGDGNGLGLAIADEIARLHGDRLSMEQGAYGKGLRIGMVWPEKL